MPTSPESFQELMVSLTRAFGWHRPAETPCGCRVPISEAHALLELSRESPLAQKDLAAALNLRKSTVSRVISNLLERGWVERVRNSRDGRVWDVSLTSAGEAAAADLARARQVKMEGILARVPEEERVSLMNSLTTLIGAIDEADN